MNRKFCKIKYRLDGVFLGGGHCYMILCKELLSKNKLINKCVSSKLQKKATEISKKKKKKLGAWSNTGQNNVGNMDTTKEYCSGEQGGQE